MIETQQTAVEFLFEEFFKVKWDDMPNRPIIFEQAKQMEKEQIIDAYEAAFENPLAGYAESYYNMNYNQNQ